MQLSLFDFIDTPEAEKKKPNKGRFQKRIHLKEITPESCKDLRIGQYITFEGNKGRFVGFTPSGSVRIVWNNRGYKAFIVTVERYQSMVDRQIKTIEAGVYYDPSFYNKWKHLLAFRALKEDFVVFFDNAGGITLQTKNYCHFYQDSKRAAADVQHLLTGDFTKYWDGNEPDHRLEAAEVEHSKDDIIDFLNNPLDYENHTGAAELEFYKTLHS
jgi:hypothetical protein